LFFFGPMVIALIYALVWRSRNHDNRWEKGIFPDSLKFNRDNLLEAYICLAALIMQKDRTNRAKKMKFLTNYFQQHFPNETYDFSEETEFSLKYPIQLKTVSFWLKKHLKDPAKRSQVLYFLAGIAVVDRVYTQQEEALMNELAALLDLSDQDLKSILAQYTFETEAEYNERKSKRDSEQSSTTLNNSARTELAYQVLGLTSSATFAEIKAAYRKLAMVHHPDKFMKESPEQIKLANERFQKILDAYELLEKLKG
jgi:DnaJ like chaperone protein